MSVTLTCINAQPLEGNDIGPPLKEGEEYQLLKKCYDSEGNEHYDVGIVSTVNYVRSHETGEELKDGDKIWWCHPSRFEMKLPLIKTEES